MFAYNFFKFTVVLCHCLVMFSKINGNISTISIFVIVYNSSHCKYFQKSKEHEIEEAIAKVLRNAPHRPGGLKFTVFCY